MLSFGVFRSFVCGPFVGEYEGIEYNVVYMIKMFWDNLLHTVKGKHDSIEGTPKKVHKKRRKRHKLWWPIPLWLDESHEDR